MIYVTDADIRQYVSFACVLDSIRRAFISLDRGEGTLFDVAVGTGGGSGHFFAIKSGRDGSIPALGLKAGSYAPDNLKRGLAAHTSTTLLIDDLTGHPYALVQANHLNGMRTAAANALATAVLAREDATTLGVIGIGGQAIHEVIAVSHVRPIQRILAAARSVERQVEFATAVGEKLSQAVEFTDPRSVVESADILVTVTPSREPVVMADWVQPGTHISAMGADGVGKHELETALFARSEVFVDWPAQAVRIGESQHAYNEGLLSLEFLEQRTLGRLLQGLTAGRTDARQITLFDSSGVAIQDIAAAHAALERIQCMKKERSSEPG